MAGRGSSRVALRTWGRLTPSSSSTTVALAGRLPGDETGGCLQASSPKASTASVSDTGFDKRFRCEGRTIVFREAALVEQKGAGRDARTSRVTHDRASSSMTQVWMTPPLPASLWSGGVRRYQAGLG